MKEGLNEPGIPDGSPFSPFVSGVVFYSLTHIADDLCHVGGKGVNYYCRIGVARNLNY